MYMNDSQKMRCVIHLLDSHLLCVYMYISSIIIKYMFWSITSFKREGETSIFLITPLQYQGFRVSTTQLCISVIFFDINATVLWVHGFYSSVHSDKHENPVDNCTINDQY